MRQQKILKKLSIINGLLLIAQISFSGLFFIMPTAVKEAQAASGGLCSQAVDTVLILDRSGSMDYASRCDWWQLKCNNPPSCSTGYTWTQKTTYNETEDWCAFKNQSAPHQSVYLAIDPKKIIAAKEAANSFLALMGTSDQSGLVSYANTAILDKALSNNHAATQTAVNGLIASGATNIGDAIKLAVGELKSARVNPQAVKNMILLTDGLANKPNGAGTGENPADVAYAESQAALAAGLGYKIFTIGLGEKGEINQTMLQNIANATGAQYYHSPAQNDLEAIYNSIATRLCQYGSIAGCKYSDANKDGNISGEEKLSDWEIKLNNDDNYSQLTDVNGCYQFSGLLPGAYTLSEGIKTGVVFEQTYPAGGSYSLNLAEGENLENKDFGNYLPVCGNSLVDANYGETCEIGQTQSCTTGSGYSGTRACRQDCGGWENCVASEYCGDGQVNNGEQCDGSAGVSEHYSCTASCILEYKPYCGDNLVNQSSEQCDGGSVICTTADGYEGTKQCNGSCGLGQCVSIEQCGDGIINGAEICDDNGQNGQYGYCNNDCTGPMPSICGNGAKEGAEQCDGQAGLGQYQSCSDTCAVINLPYCGNGIIEDDEQCDDGNNTNSDGCSAVCAVEPLALRAGDIIINELMWPGAASSTADEWLELRNLTNRTIDLSDCQLTRENAGSETLMLIIPGGKTIGADDYFLIANYNETNSHLAIEPQVVDTAVSLANTNLQIKLYCGGDWDNGGLLLDTADDGEGAPLAGDNGASKKSMQRKLAVGDGTAEASWCTAATQVNWDANATELGTPGALNDCAVEAVCGNQIRETGEECDGADGVGAHQSCSSACLLINELYCGDGITNGGEQCDDGNTASGDGCSTSCALENNGGGGIDSCKISGYKLEDLDGLASTTADRGGLAGWTINLFDYQASSTAKAIATTTNAGYFEFAGLAPGDYFLTENLTDSWAQLAAPEPLLNLDLASSSSLTDKNFINYKIDNKLTALFDARDENNVIEIARPIYGRIISTSSAALGNNLLVRKLETFTFMADDQNTAGLVIELQPGAKTSLNNAIASSSAGAVMSFFFANGSATSTLSYADKWRYGLDGDNLYVFLNPNDTLAKNLTVNLPYTFELTIANYAAVFGSSDSAAIIKKIRGMQGIGKIIPPQAPTPGGGGAVTISTTPVGGAVILPQNTVGQNGGLTVQPALTTPLVLGISGAPQLTIKKSVAKNKETGLDFYAPGDKNIEYKITVNNNGNLTAVNAVVNDDLPPGLTYSDDGKTGRIWNLGDIKSGETKNINYTVNLAVGLATGKYANTATVKADNHAPVTAKADLNVKEAKIAGAKLAGSGFKFSEFITLLFALLLLLTLIVIIKMKYLKANDPNKNLLKKF